MDQLKNLLKIKLFADGADLSEMVEQAAKPFISGLTTNPTLMRKAGVSDYEGFAKIVLKEITVKPISFEVFSDDLKEMQYQAHKISSWGENVYVKIPITNTAGVSTIPIIEELLESDVKVNVTALMTVEQVVKVSKCLGSKTPSYVSIFAGRIADTGVDPTSTMVKSLEILKENTKTELIWASPRELLNVFQANNIGCHIITATNDILLKLDKVGYDLSEYSLDTVKMFHTDAKMSGFGI